MTELETMPGIGFLLTVFVLYCFYPETYPVFDQHAYRAHHGFYILVTRVQEVTRAVGLCVDA